jgi:hypothetical protein
MIRSVVRGRAAWALGAGVAAAMLVVGWIDLERTNDRVPPFRQGTDTLARLHRIQQLDSDFDQRVWIYAAIAAAALAVSCLGADRRRAFQQAGVAGVVLGVAAVILSVLGSHGVVDPPLAAMLLPSLTLLAIASIGGTARRLRGESRPPEELSLKAVAMAALTCTAITVVLAYVYASGQDAGCDPPSTDAWWSGAVGWAAVVTAGIAVLLGLAGLAARRWVVALTCVVVNPAALLYMIASSGAFC